jgi:hypothetical protein
MNWRELGYADSTPREKPSWLEKRRHLFFLDVSLIVAIAKVGSSILVVLYKGDLLYYSFKMLFYQFRIRRSKCQFSQSYQNDPVIRIIPHGDDCLLETQRGYTYIAYTNSRTIATKSCSAHGSYGFHRKDSIFRTKDYHSEIMICQQMCRGIGSRDFIISLPYNDILGVFDGMKKKVWVITRSAIHLLDWRVGGISVVDVVNLGQANAIDKILAADPFTGSFIMQFSGHTNQILDVRLSTDTKIVCRRLYVEYLPLFITAGISMIMYDPVQKWFHRDRTFDSCQIVYNFYVPNHMPQLIPLIDSPRKRLYSGHIKRNSTVSLGIDAHGLLRNDIAPPDIYPLIREYPGRITSLRWWSSSGKYGIIQGDGANGLIYCIGKDGKIIGKPFASRHLDEDAIYNTNVLDFFLRIPTSTDDFYILRTDGTLSLFGIDSNGVYQKSSVFVSWTCVSIKRCVIDYTGRYIIALGTECIFVLDIQTNRFAHYEFGVDYANMFVDSHGLVYFAKYQRHDTVFTTFDIYSLCDTKLFHLDQYRNVGIPRIRTCSFHDEHRMIYTTDEYVTTFRGVRIPTFHGIFHGPREYLREDVNERIEILLTLWCANSTFVRMFAHHHLELLCNAICYSYALPLTPVDFPVLIVNA